MSAMRRYTVKDHKREQQMFRRRALLSGAVVLAALGVLFGRYYQLQITEFQIYHTESERNRVHVQPVPPRRGVVFDRNGVVVADNRPSYTLNIIKERVDDLPRTLALLKEILGLEDDDVERFREQIRRQRPFEPIPVLFQLTDEQIAKVAVNRHRLPGVEVEAQLIRHYPRGPLLAHVLGYVGRISEKEEGALDPVNYAGTHYIGKTGVERFYEDALHGEVGSENVETNARGRVLRVLEHSDPIPGRNLTLHLDVRLQEVAEQALAGRRGAVVALDPNTGAVLAAVSTPSFDPNLFVRGISAKNYTMLREDPDIPLFNRILQAQYPPGSTIKPIMGLAGLHYGIRRPEDTIGDPGWYQIPNDSRFYRDWKRWGHGTVDLRKAIAESCDIYFYDLAFKMGVDRIREFGLHFGLGEKTGIDLTNERGGLLPSREWKLKAHKVPWYRGETLSVGIGQGYMLATPLQLAVAAGTLATRGVRMQPMVVKAVGDEPVPPRELGRMQGIRPSDWDAVWAGMIDVVHGPTGTAKGIAKGIRYQMAGKTGTAQVVGIKQGERYDASKIHARRRDHALFIAFAPVEAPRIAVGVIVENGEHGSTTAAPVARKVIDAYLLGPEAVAAEAPATNVEAGHEPEE